MKKYLLLVLFFLLLCHFSFSQANRRYIFLWDVTRSMEGYGGKPNIFNIVKHHMIDVLNSLDSDGGEILIFSFQDKILDKKYFTNDSENREEAKRYINNYKIVNNGNTNICGAWDDAMNIILNKDNTYLESIFFIYTDGFQNIPYGEYGNNCLQYITQKYCKLTSNLNSFTFFISLNSNLSSLDKNFLKDACKNVSFSEIIDIKVPKYIKVSPRFKSINFNIGSVKGFKTCQVFESTGGKLPSDFKFDISYEFLSKQNTIKYITILNSKFNQNQVEFNFLLHHSIKLSNSDIISGKVYLKNPSSCSSYNVIRFFPETFDFFIRNIEIPKVELINIK